MRYSNYESARYETLKDLYEAAERRGEAVCLASRNGTESGEVSYRQLLEESRALAAELIAYGLSGGHVLLLGENGREWVTSFLAITSGVGVAIPLDTEIGADELKRLAGI